MRMALNIAAGILLSVMLAEPVMAQSGLILVGSSDLSLMALGLAGVVLGQRGGRKVAKLDADEA